MEEKQRMTYRPSLHLKSVNAFISTKESSTNQIERIERIKKRKLGPESTKLIIDPIIVGI